MDDTLLFLHVLAAFALMAGIVMFSAAALGVTLGSGQFFFANRLTDVGATVALVFGVWIVLREDVYDITDGWILGAIVLWVAAVATGSSIARFMPEGTTRVEGKAVALHWLTAALATAILVLMVWKPGA